MHQKQKNRLFDDPWASLLSPSEPLQAGVEIQPHPHPHIAATAQLDSLLLNTLSSTSVNKVNPGDYRQVILFTDGYDTRPFRIPFPEGTVIYLISPSECHEKAEAVLKEAGAMVPRGCLLRRIDLNLGSVSEDGVLDESILSGLERAGYRSDRVSVWVLQGGVEVCISCSPSASRPETVLSSLLAQIADLAAYSSILIGEVFGENRLEKDALSSNLAATGFLGTVMSMDGSQGEGEGEGKEDGKSLVFSSQHLKLSLRQMGIYSAHSKEAEDLDEDFGPGNFS